jgi:DNA repair exonuclease SbcCD nuclease subunit
MSIAHISDTHLGYSQFNLEEREQDVYSAFEQAIDISIKERVQAVILAGDIFHMPKPEGAAIVKFGNELKRLKENDIKVFFVLGEHDLSRVRGVPVPFAFHNLGFATYMNNGSVEFNNTLFMGFDKFRTAEISELIEKLREADRHASKFKGHRILVLHQGLTEFNKFAGEITVNDLPKNFTYYAMGHYHDRKEQRFGELSGLLAYPGSTEVTASEGIRETEKGFYTVDLSGREAVTHWHKLDIRPQIGLDVKYDELLESIDELSKRITKFSKKPIINVKVKGKNIDSKDIAASLTKISELVLHYTWSVMGELSSYVMFDEKPDDIETELFSLALKEIGNEGLAKFAVKELLPLLELGRVKDAASIAWENYEKFKG